MGKDWRFTFKDNKEVAKEKKEKIRKCLDATLMKIVEKRENHTEIKKERRVAEREREERKETKWGREKTKTEERENERDEKIGSENANQ